MIVFCALNICIRFQSDFESVFFLVCSRKKGAVSHELISFNQTYRLQGSGQELVLEQRVLLVPQQTRNPEPFFTENAIFYSASSSSADVCRLSRFRGEIWATHQLPESIDQLSLRTANYLVWNKLQHASGLADSMERTSSWAGSTAAHHGALEQLIINIHTRCGWLLR